MSESKEQPQTKIAVGDVVTYRTIDMESYSRGYGIHYETKASSVITICYKMANGDIIEGKDLFLVESKSETQKTQ